MASTKPPRSLIRSPLELLADEQTPPPKRPNGSLTPSPQLAVLRGAAATEDPHRGAKDGPNMQHGHNEGLDTAVGPRNSSSMISVTRTTDNSKVAVPFGAKESTATLREVLGSATPQHQLQDKATLQPAAALPLAQHPEEPSALLFMSPQQKKKGSASDVGSRRHHHGRDTDEASRRSGKTSDGTQHLRPIEVEGVVSVSEAHAMVTEALEVYEQRRDDEEAKVLEAIRDEIGTLRGERDAAQRSHSSCMSELEESQSLVAKLEAQCLLLSETTQQIHNELQHEKKRTQQMGIELCHLEDAKRISNAEHLKELQFERAQWTSMKEELEGRLHKECEDHAREVEQLRFQLHESTAQCAEYKSRLDAAATASKGVEQRLSVTSDELKASQAAMLQLRQEAEERSDAMQHLSKRSRALEKSDATRREELSKLEAQVKSLESALKSQGDDVRKKMYRIQQLEAELVEQRNIAESYLKEVTAQDQRSGLVSAAVDALYNTLRAGSTKLRRVTERSSAASMGALKQLRHENEVNAVSDADDDDDDFFIVSDNDADLCCLGEAPKTAALRQPFEPVNENGRAATVRKGRKVVTDGVIRPAATTRSSSENKDRVKTAVLPSSASAATTLRLLTEAHRRVHTLLRKLLLRSQEDAERAAKRSDDATHAEELATKCNATMESLRQERDQARAEAAKVQERLEASQEVLRRLQEDAPRKQAEIHDLRVRLKLEADRQSKHTFELEELRALCDQHKQSLRDSKGLLEVETSKTERLEAQLKQDRVKVESMERELKEKTVRLDDEERRVANLSREVADVADQRQRAQKQLSRLHAELAHVRTELTKAQDDLHTLTLRHQKSEASLASLRKSRPVAVPAQNATAVSTLESRMEELRREAEGARLQLQQVSRENQAALAMREATIEDLTVKLNKYKQRMSVLLATHDSNVQQASARMTALVTALQDGFSRRLAAMAMTPAAAPPVEALFGTPGAATRPESVVAVALSPTEHPQRSPYASLPPISTPSSPRGDSPHIVAATTPTSAMLQTLESLERLALHLSAASEYHEMKLHNQIRSLQQTIGFLELEMRCQASAAASGASRRTQQQTLEPGADSFSPIPIPPFAQNHITEDTTSPQNGHYVVVDARALAASYSAPHTTAAASSGQSVETRRRGGETSMSAPLDCAKEDDAVEGRVVPRHTGSSPSPDAELCGEPRSRSGRRKDLSDRHLVNSRSPSVESAGGASVSVAGSRSVDGLSASPLRPPSLRNSRASVSVR